MKIQIKNLITDIISGEWGEEPKGVNDVKVIRTANFTNWGEINFRKIATRSIEPLKVQKKKLVKGDIIIEKSGGSPSQPVGRVVFFDIDDDVEFLCNNFTATLRPDQTKVYPKFLFYQLFIIHQHGRTLKYQNKTTGIINLKLMQYLNETIDVPSLSDQIKIVKVLTKAETLIKERNKNLDLLDEFLKSTFLKMFGVPKEMKKQNLERLGDFIEFMTSGSRGWAKHYSETGAKFLRIQNVWKGNLRLDDLQLVTVPNSQEATRTKVQEGDLLLTITADLGRTAVVPKNFGDAYINQHLVLIRLNEKVNPVYAAYFFFMPFGYSIIQKKNKSSVKAGLNFNDIHSFEILVPPIEAQNRFASIVEKAEVLKLQIQNSLNDLEDLYASLSQQAFKGNLDLSGIKVEKALLMEGASQRPLKSISLHIQEALNIASKITSQFENVDKITKVTSDVKKQIDEWNRLLDQFKNLPKLPASVLEAQKNMIRVQDIISKMGKGRALKEEGFNWAILANQIKIRYKDLHFNFEMLINFILREKLTDTALYYASEELKVNPRLNDTEDLKSFIQSAVQNVEMDEKQRRQTNPFLGLIQFFYNAEEENFTLSLHHEDFKLVKNRKVSLRSGIYFRIATKA